MPNTHTISRRYQSEGGSITISTRDIVVGRSANVEEVIPVSAAADVPVDFLATVAELKGFAFGCRRATGAGPGAVSLTVKTNNATTPIDTFVLTDVNGVAWVTGDPGTNPLTADVTGLFVTNTGEVDTELIIRAGYDPTP